MASEADGTTTEDQPLIDLNEASIKKLIAKAKRKGYVTVDELNEALPQDQMSTDQIEDIMSAISEMGVNVVESDEDTAEEDDDDEDDNAVEEISAGDDGASTKNVAEPKRKKPPNAPTIRCACTLREMGAVELLSREGEIAIAKRIEAGRDTMIMGLCESPITFHAIILWSEALNSEEMQLREILDLDAMLGDVPGAEGTVVEPRKRKAETDISEEIAAPI